MTELQYLPGVGPRRAELLDKELHIRSAEELIGYFPYRYIDKSRIYSIREIDGTMPYILLRGHFTRFEEVGTGAGARLVGTFTDGTGSIECVWFKGQKYILNSVDKGREYLLFGKPTVFQMNINIAHPELEVSVDDATDEEKQGLSGMYNTTEKMKRAAFTSKALQKIILGYFKRHLAPFAETLPAYVVERMKLMNYNTAIRQIHFPANPENLRQAQFRFKFEELFYLELYLVRSFKMRQKALAGFPFTRIGEYFNNFYTQCLPFELTGAQKRVLKEIRADVGSGRQMNRLLQGDVGSGKTLVALMSMLMALDNGFQACMMAPTEILATQHYENLAEMLTRIGIRVALLTGSTPKKQRDKIHAALEEGSLHILIGTHALIEPVVKFRNLGLVVIDEQHRFGVKQRSLLWQKNLRPPHVLVMTATPIPRTLAMTVYGDLDVSVIDELPPGRKPIQTLHRYDNQRLGLNQAIRGQLKLGRQVYVVYPLIEENEKLAYRNVEEGFQVMQEAFPEYRVVMVHGKMKPKEKEAAMQRFVTNEAQIMVATTVIEVGVNVPNASVMIIESAERFGLSQLHQLRGRVGRGADQSYCILVTNYKLSEDTRKRMEIMCRTTDGFEIAEADLKMRGPGDLEGTQQSGLAFDLHIASLARDGQILTRARELAMEIVERDPMLEAPANNLLRTRLEKLFEHKVDWSRIS
jgi:ATP-dependent DNA helicase RecG